MLSRTASLPSPKREILERVSFRFDVPPKRVKSIWVRKPAAIPMHVINGNPDLRSRTYQPGGGSPDKSGTGAQRNRDRIIQVAKAFTRFAPVTMEVDSGPLPAGGPGAIRITGRFPRSIPPGPPSRIQTILAFGGLVRQ